ncbi:MAG: glycoside hydrolase family 13 protein [Thermoflexales bacterium]|nr:glycoside hydrolase family 13 protein [Thermoflexales bacterium]
MNITTPAWVPHAVFYQIFPDRFASSAALTKPSHLEAWDHAPTTRGFKGGDLLGVVEKLDYLQDLGATAIYFTPIFQSTANHRYHTHDYYRIDPILGGNEAFKVLLDAAHARGMKVVIDGVFNHASRGFYYFNHALENGRESPFLDWFHFNHFPLHAYEEKKPLGYEAWWGIPDLPKFNTNTPAVREYIFRVAEYWIEQGADGWRLDVPAEINDDSFWSTFRARVKAVNPEAYIVGEIWHEAQRWLRGDQFDGVMNYQFTKACLGFFVGRNLDEKLAADVGYAPVRPVDAAGFAGMLLRNLGLYDWSINLAQLNVLDSHDTARFLSIARGDVNALKLATLCQMCYPGAPSIYYGDEVGMLGAKDPDNRRGFPWETARWDNSLRDYVKRAIALRARFRALRDGEFGILHAAGDVVAILRKRGEEKIIAVFNAGEAGTTVRLNVAAVPQIRDGSMLIAEFGTTASYAVAGHQAEIRIGPREGLVFRVG